MPDAVSHDGTRIRYYVDGPPHAPVLLFSNSIGTTHELWAPQLEACAARFRVVRYDARGHGGSSVPPGDYSLDDLGHDAVAVLDACEAATAHVCGLSLGGITAMWLAVNAPDRLRTLTLANTAAWFGGPERWIERIKLVRGQGMGAIADMVIGRWFTPPFIARHPETAAAFRRTLLACSPQGYAGCCAILRDGDLRDAIRGIRTPTLVIGGTGDIATPMDDAELIAGRIPGAKLVALDAGHLSNVEQPDAFTEAVLNHGR